MSNPLNIRPGDVTELTGERWTSDIRGRRQEVTSVTTDSVYYIGGHHMTNPPEGYEHIIHYTPQEGDRYYVEHNGVTYFIEGGRIWWQDKDLRRECRTPLDQITSEVFTRLAPEEPTPLRPNYTAEEWLTVNEAPPATTKQWVSVAGHEVEDGEKVRVPGDSREPYTVLGNSVLIAPGVSVCVDHFDELEVLREVIELPTQFGHYESMREGTTFDLDENGWTEKYGGKPTPLTREEVEGVMPLTRILTAEEADERKQHALTLQREQNEGKRANARARYDRYQEELMSIIRRRNEENLRLRELLEEAGIKW